MLRQILFLSSLVFLWTCSSPWRSGPETIYTGGVIYTVDPLQPLVTGMAVRDGRILALGGDKEMLALAGTRTEVVDLGGQFVMPGLIEGHGHFRGIGEWQMAIGLMHVLDWNGALAKVEERVQTTPAGKWINGRGWHQEKWQQAPSPAVEGYPTHEGLSAVSADHPVLLKHASGHALIANQHAMAIAGVTAATPDPVGGRIIRDKNGNPTGIFEENAMDLITDAFEVAMANRSEEEIEAEEEHLIALAGQACLAFGITSFQDAGSSRKQIERYHRLAIKGLLPLRLWVMLIEPFPKLEEALDGLPWIGLGEDFFTVRSIKAYMDGALGSHGAWLLKPYDDKPGHIGLNVTSPDTINAIGRMAMDHNMQFCVHAIGDFANRKVLDGFELLFQEKPSPVNKPYRWRIEHAQHLDSADIPRFHQLGVIASMQPIHCISDAPFVEKRLGVQRAKSGAYVWRSLLESKARLAMGTDAPVESTDPFANMYAAVTRKRLDNKVAFYPEQIMDRKEVLYAYTLGNAYAAFEEEHKGSLSPGKWADFVILNQDITHCTDEALLETKVLKTFIAGKQVYSLTEDR